MKNPKLNDVRNLNFYKICSKTFFSTKSLNLKPLVSIIKRIFRCQKILILKTTFGMVLHSLPV